MRRFHSYGPVDKELHFYAPREALIQQATQFLVGEYPHKGGHFFTVWAPRQTGKTWIMNEVKARLTSEGNYHVIFLNLEVFKNNQDQALFLRWFVDALSQECPKGPLPFDGSWPNVTKLFSRDYFDKPVLLIIDEFDALDPVIIDQLVSVFRTIYLQRGILRYSTLHGLALVGVRAVIGILSSRGSPFNIQRSLHIPQLTKGEVKGMFEDYQRESAQAVDPEVVAEVYAETLGQPGLVSWFGELLTETYNQDLQEPIGIKQWRRTLNMAINALPNNTILNLVAKAKDENYKDTLLSLFNTKEARLFSFDDEKQNYLYMNGLIDYTEEEDPQGSSTLSTRFTCPFIQKRLFQALSNNLFGNYGVLLDPTDDLSDAILPSALVLKKLLGRYRDYLQKHSATLFKAAPRRQDGRLFEAVFHFHLYYFLKQVLSHRKGIELHAEFPTGNGKVDLLFQYQQQQYALELKSFRDTYQYQEALAQAACYGQRLKLSEITLCIFIEGGNEDFYQQLEAEYLDDLSGVKVIPIVVPVMNL